MTEYSLYLLFLTLLFSFALGSIVSLVFSRNNRVSLILGSFFATLGSLIGIIYSSLVIIQKSELNLLLSLNNNLLNVNINVSPFSAIFILIISTLGFFSSIYGAAYLKSYEKEYNLGLFSFFYNLFILSQILVVTSYNAIFFLYVWELMSLSSLFLVIFEHKKQDALRAGIVYFIMTHVGTLFITLAFFIIYLSLGTFDFTEIYNLSKSIPSLQKNLAFILFLIGFGTKSGIIPFHIWLPRAHGSAPSHVSALMSGVMIKMGIFMMIRMFIEIFNEPPLFWGISILVIGAVNSLLGVLYALAEHDIKRLLAYHSIENIGIILMGLGTSLTFLSLGNFGASSLALTASIFHTANHATFKSLLFLAAGSVISKTHTRNIEEYGGLIKKMPYTSLFFLIGAVAISGLPPFNGFASEWLTYNSLITGVGQHSVILKGIFIFGVVSLAFTGGLASACFVKAFGTTFLARPRNAKNESVKEVQTQMLFSMAFLSTLCLILGIGSAFVVKRLNLIVGKLYSSQAESIVNHIQINLFAVFAFLVITFFLAYLIFHFIRKSRKEIKDITWNCGFSYESPRGEITATGFARSLIVVFRGIFLPSKQTSIEYVDAVSKSRYFTKSHKVMLSTLNIYEVFFYRPLDRFVQNLSEKVRYIQTGNINLYLFYILMTLVTILIWVRYF